MSDIEIPTLDEIQALASPPTSTPWVPLWPLAPYPATPAIGARVYNSADQTLPTASPTIIGFNSEWFDTDNCHDTVTNNSRLTCRTAGKYLVNATCMITANATGERQLQLLLNGSGAEIASVSCPAVATNVTKLNLTSILDLNVGDYIQVAAFTTAGVSLTMVAAAGPTPAQAPAPMLSMILIPPGVIAGGFGSATYGPTLPASPSDGQEHVLVDSASNPTYQWRLRYNASSTSPYKWEFVGGAPWSKHVAATESTGSGAFTDLTTVVSLAVPRAGEYLAQAQHAAFWGNISGGAVPAGLALLFGAVTVDASSIQVTAPPYPGVAAYRGALAANDVIKTQYKSSNNTVNVQNRTLTVTPIRVS